MVSYFLIMIGPPGSGKSYVASGVRRYLAEKYGNYQKKEFAALIDDYVEKDAQYITESVRLTSRVYEDPNVRKVINESMFPEKGVLENDIIALDTYADDFEGLYFRIRKTYDSELTNNMKNALMNRQNIRFETTGMGDISWLIENTPLGDPDVRKDYKVVIVYPYVQTSIIFDRAVTRFTSRANRSLGYDNIDKYIEDVQNNKDINPPRYVRIYGNKSLSTSITRIQDNISQHIDGCVGQDIFVDNVLLVDNTPGSGANVLLDIKCSGNRTNIVYRCDRLRRFLDRHETDLTESLHDAMWKVCKDKDKDHDGITGGDRSNKYRYKYEKYRQKLLQISR